MSRGAGSTSTRPAVFLPQAQLVLRALARLLALRLLDRLLGRGAADRGGAGALAALLGLLLLELLGDLDRLARRCDLRCRVGRRRDGDDRRHAVGASRALRALGPGVADLALGAGLLLLLLLLRGRLLLGEAVR